MDAAGNVNETNLSLATVWVAPALSIEAPYYRNSSAVGWLHTLGSTLLPHQGARLVEWELDVRDNATNASVYGETTNLTGAFSKPWDASAASPGLYNVTLRAGNGPVSRVAWFSVRVDAPSTTEPTPLDRSATYGRLQNDTSIAWYKLVWSGCGSAFTARARSMDGLPIHLYVDAGASHYGDRDTFDHRLTSNATSQSVRLESPAQGQEYTLVATTPATQGTPFELRVDRHGCEGGGPQPANALPNIQIERI